MSRAGLVAVVLLGCRPGEVDEGEATTDEPGPPFTCEPGWDLSPEGYCFGADGVAARLHPYVTVDGQRLEGSACKGEAQDGACEVAGGVFRVSADSGVLRLRFIADGAVTVTGLGFEGELWVDGADQWLSNGFQSWSNSGTLALAEAPAEEDLAIALGKRADAEVLREGTELSWFHTAVGGGEAVFGAAALGANHSRPWIAVHTAGDRLSLRIASGDSGEVFDLAVDESVDAETFAVWASTAEDPWAGWTPWLADRPPIGPFAGWNSWYDLWDGIDAQIILDNAALYDDVTEGATPAQPWIVIDDGWQEAWGDWSPDEGFGGDLAPTVAALNSEGFRVGLWFAPFLAHKDSAVYQAHPEWFLPEATYLHLGEGQMRILDATDPEAAAHLGDVVRSLTGAGVEILKIDFLFAGSADDLRDEAVTGMEAYVRGLEVIREAAGDDVVLLAVGAPQWPTLDHVDAWRTGGDIALEPLGPSIPFVVSQLRSYGARSPLCRTTWCDTEPALLRELPPEQVQAAMAVGGISGDFAFLSDDLRALPEDRWGPAQDPVWAGLATGGVGAVPDSLWLIDPPEVLAGPHVDHGSDRWSLRAPEVWRQGEARLRFNFSPDPVEDRGETIDPGGVSRTIGD